MSDSWISWTPRTDEPSNGWPSANFSSVSSWIGSDRCCTWPGRSVKRRSTICAPASLAMAMTSLGDFGLPTVLLLPLRQRRPTEGRGAMRGFHYPGVNSSLRPTGDDLVRREVDVERDDATGQQQVHAVGGVEVARAGSGHAGVPVLEDDAVRRG